MNEKEYSVSEAVRRTGVPSHVLRYWEEELQINIHRSAQGYRIYREADIALFRKVKNLKEKGIQLKAIRVLLEEQTNGEKYVPEQRFGDQIREIVYQNEETEVAEAEETESVYGIVLQAQPNDQLKCFEAILRQMMEEIMEEQNEKLELTLKECLREELEELYLRFLDEAVQEAAAEQAPRKRHFWEWLRRK